MREKGFTLIEMMVVLLILAISAGILVLQIPPSKNQLEKQQAEMLLRSLQSIQSYAFTQNTSIEYRFNPFGYEIKNVDPRFLQLWGLPGSVYALGTGQAWIAVGLGLGTIANWLIIARPLRAYTIVAGNSMTLPEFFGNRYHDEKKIS